MISSCWTLEQMFLCFPMGNSGMPSIGRRAILEDAQGNRVQSYGRRLGDIELDNDNQRVVIQDGFIVASVQNPLVSLGRLFKKGWSFTAMEEAAAGVGLLSPDNACLVPVVYKKKFLAVRGLLRQVRLKEDEVQAECKVEEEDVAVDDAEYCLIQTFVRVKDEMLERPFYRGWRRDLDGRPFRFRRQCREYQDPSFHWEWREWPLRSILIREEGQNKWLVVDLCQNYRLLPSVEGPIEESDEAKDVLTEIK